MIRPCNDFVLLEKEKAEEKTASGIILTDKNTEKPTVGKVLAVNNGHEAVSYTHLAGVGKYEDE